MTRLLVLAVGLAVLIATPAHAGVLRGGDIVALTFEGVLIKIDPETGSQSVIASGGLLSNPHGLAVTPWGDVAVVPPICPCAGAKNHGSYVSCVSHKVHDYPSDGLMTRAERAAIVSGAAQSFCGKPGKSVG